MKLLWDFRIQTDHHLDHNRPDIVVMEKASRVCQIIDVACPFDTRIAENGREKIDHYQDFKGEIQKMWSCKSVSILFFHLYLGHLGSDQKLHDVGYQDRHTKDLEFTPESLLVRNN